MNLQALKTEITTDPAAVGYAAPLAAGDHNAVAALLNARPAAGQNWTVNTGSVPIVALTKWMAHVGVRSNVEDAIKMVGNFTSLTPALRGVCLAVNDLLVGSITGSIDVTDPEIQSMAQSLVGAAVMSQQNYTDFLALATVPASRFEVVSGVAGVTAGHSDVTAAMGA